MRGAPALPPSESPLSEYLSSVEAEACERAQAALDSVSWAQPLLNEISSRGGIRTGNMDLLFELRFAHALHCACVSASYEVPGESESTLDFGFTVDGQEWVVEMMRLRETDAAAAATNSLEDADGVRWSQRVLGSDAEDDRQSEEGETLKAVERICQKLEKNGRPHKFRLPAGQANLLLVDFRNFLFGGDIYDRVHVGLGGRFLRDDWFRRYYRGRLISGVFDESTCLRGAREARERLHFIGFVDERPSDYSDFGGSTQFIANPQLFCDERTARDMMSKWPLRPAKALNLPNASAG